MSMVKVASKCSLMEDKRFFVEPCVGSHVALLGEGGLALSAVELNIPAMFIFPL